jgi:hypothetical protein
LPLAILLPTTLPAVLQPFLVPLDVLSQDLDASLAAEVRHLSLGLKIDISIEDAAFSAFFFDIAIVVSLRLFV